MAEHTRISVSLALKELQDAVADVETHKASLAASRAVRDGLIRDALKHVPRAQLVRITGLSRERIYRIEHEPAWKAEA